MISQTANRYAGAVQLLATLALLGLTLMGFPTSSEADGPLVLAFYYAWYDLSTWSSGQLSDLPAQQYVSADSGTISRHVSQAQSAGVDAFVQSWYGPGAGNQTESNFQMLLTAAEASRFRAAVDFEVASPYFATAADRIAALQQLLTVHASHPAYLRVDGKPVVFFWASWLLSVDEWANIRAQVDPGHSSLWLAEGASTDYLAVFDGLHVYNIAWSDNPAGTLAYWSEQVRSWAALLGSYKYWAATVMPGWDDTGIPGRSDAFVRDRAGGAYYRECWSGAVSSSPDMVIITSFNEWLEGSMIEPSVSYGDTYLRLTAELAAAYKAGIVPAPPSLPITAPSATTDAAGSPAESSAEPIPTTADTGTPPASPTVLPDGSIVHVVQEGDTLLGIGSRYDVTLEELLQLNDMEPESYLWIGQRITVRILSTSPTPVLGTSATSPSPAATVTPSGMESESPEADGIQDRKSEPGLVERAPEAETVVVIAPTAITTPDSRPEIMAAVEPARTESNSGAALWTGCALAALGAGVWLFRRRRAD